MKVSGFSIIRNAITYDYPIVESIYSILPLCDEFVIAVGQSSDETRELIQNITSDKIKIIDTVWDESLREGGKVLADETNKALRAVSKDSTWCFYIQGDEIIHEKYHENIMHSMLKWKDDMRVEGLLFQYKHFYGSYDFIADSRKWYKNEVRIIRNDSEIYSFRDAQGFQKNGRPLNVKPSGGKVYHYGWVKHPKHQQLKQLNFNKLWHSDEKVRKMVPDVNEFDYSGIDSVQVFKGTHPAVIQERIKAMNWKIDIDPSRKRLNFKNRILNFLKKKFNISIGEYKNYRLLK